MDPVCCFMASFLASCVADLRVRHLLQANKVVHLAKTKSVTLHFRNLGLRIKSFVDWTLLRFLVFSDASFNVGDRKRSQGGHLIFISRDVPLTSRFIVNLLAWRSSNLRRVVYSTLGGETISATTGFDLGSWLDAMLVEMITGYLPLRPRTILDVLSANRSEDPQQKFLPIDQLTDCKSLVDHLISLSQASQLQERRLVGDLCVLREALETKQLRSILHCPTKKMLADALTKDMDAEQLRDVLNHGFLEM